jgi:hypothetical protein
MLMNPDKLALLFTLNDDICGSIWMDAVVTEMALLEALLLADPKCAVTM